ncbi:hypothetical protein OESDEN_12481 [Oesophagostomum dentatum]|uniref:Uncharacterized protein n=1 Tax=Oesophagostomum dentatum TaxID=61180 RepID=A0A0B1SW47_OESDE|nr:hypothetical protein OESDEN_12481 [Oesophagostomum dentatum]
MRYLRVRMKKQIPRKAQIGLRMKRRRRSLKRRRGERSSVCGRRTRLDFLKEHSFPKKGLGKQQNFTGLRRNEGADDCRQQPVIASDSFATQEII